MDTPNPPLVFHYVFWKAVLFGVIPAALGAGMIWIGVLALDPTWTAEVAKGQFLVDAPPWIRSPVMFATGAFVFVPGLRLLIAAATHASVVSMDDRGVSARTIFGRLRHLDWPAVKSVKRKKNQIILSPVGADTLGQEIWDRISVVLDIGMLDAPAAELEAHIRRHRPDLVIPAPA